jgi:hypothetical protein
MNPGQLIGKSAAGLEATAVSTSRSVALLPARLLSVANIRATCMKL